LATEEHSILDQRAREALGFFFFFFFFAQPWDQGSGAIKGSFGFLKNSHSKKKAIR
jgi:hypothetical protein